jgi:hypothetical protein
MSDFIGSMPVKTQEIGDVKIIVADPTITSQQMAVNADGSINTQTEITAPVDLSASTLAALEDINATVSGTVELGATTLSALEDITATVDGTVELGATTLAALEDINATVSGTVEIGATSLAALETTTANQGAPNTIANAWSVKITNGTNTVAPNSDGSLNVKIIESSGSDVNDYNAAATLAGGASSNHDYTVAGTDFYLTQIVASSPSKMKIEILVNGVTKYVLFNSPAEPNVILPFKEPMLAAVGQVVRVIRTNLENQSSSAYSTISGYKI